MTNSLSKPKKKNTLVVRVEPVKGISKPAKQVKEKTQAAKSVKVKQRQVKPAQARVQQAPPYRNEDFKFATTGDATGVNIFITFLTRPIHRFNLHITDYRLWIRMNPQQKYDYVRGRVNTRIFWNDAQLVHEVILTICNILDTLFAEAQKRRM